MPRKNHYLGPARPEIMAVFESDNLQRYIIGSGRDGAKRRDIIRHCVGDEHILEGGPIRVTEWALARLHLKSLGYRSTRESGWNWVHPHYYLPAIALKPMTNGVTFNNGNPRKSNLTPIEKERGTGAPNAWGINGRNNPNPDPVEAREAKTVYNEERKLVAGEDESLIAEHTRAGGRVTVKEHIRKKRLP